MERVFATVVASKDSDVRPYILRPGSTFTGEIVTEVIDTRKGYDVPAVRFFRRYVDGKEA